MILVGLWILVVPPMLKWGKMKIGLTNIEDIGIFVNINIVGRFESNDGAANTYEWKSKSDFW